MKIVDVLLDSNACAGAAYAIAVRFSIDAPLITDIECCVDFFGADHNVTLHDSFYTHVNGAIDWLPRGQFEFIWRTRQLSMPSGCQRVCVRLFGREAGEIKMMAVQNLPFPDVGGLPGIATKVDWQLSALAGTTAISELAWNKRHTSWFYSHFDWAARQVVEEFGGNLPLWRGRVLDVGCGDGITDLGIAMRFQPKELIGVDPFKGYERLRSILDENHLAHLALPDNLKFYPYDANALPFEDNSFDALLSWGSIEHMVGGYKKALDEMRRVLKPGGIMFMAPGLYYSNIGHHLTEFTKMPFAHLNMTPEALRELVINTPPNYIDRSGEFSPPAQFWQWYTELNPITVDQLEAELRALDFEPWRFAIRDENLVEYTPQMQGYSMNTLSQREMYSTWFNRKS